MGQRCPASPEGGAGGIFNGIRNYSGLEIRDVVEAEYVGAGGACGPPVMLDLDDKVLDRAIREHDANWKQAASTMLGTLTSLDAIVWDVPAVNKNCFVYAYLALSAIFGQKVEDFSVEGWDGDVHAAAVKLRVKLRAKVSSMLEAAQMGGAEDAACALRDFLNSLEDGSPVTEELWGLFATVHDCVVYVVRPVMEGRVQYLAAARYAADRDGSNDGDRRIAWVYLQDNHFYVMCPRRHVEEEHGVERADDDLGVRPACV